MQLVWQAEDDQEWTVAIRRALTGEPTAPAGSDHAAFSLADPTLAAGVLKDAGLTAVEITDVHEPVYYGPDATNARDALFELGMIQDATADMDQAETARALDRLMDMLDTHDTGEGVCFDARAWLITARRR